MIDAKTRYITTYFMVIAAASVPITVSAAASPTTNHGSPRLDERYEDSLLGYLRPALFAAKKAGRVYYVVPCRDPDHDFPVPFPDVRVQAPSNNRNGLEAVREIFRDDQRVTVSEEPDGIIKVRVGDVPAAILQTRLPLVNLKANEQYDATLAILAFTGAKAVRVAMRELGLQEAAAVGSIPLNLPAKPAPHLPAIVKDVTLDKALDIVARTFGVIVVFGECTNSTGASFMRIYAVRLQDKR